MTSLEKKVVPEKVVPLGGVEQKTMGNLFNHKINLGLTADEKKIFAGHIKAASYLLSEMEKNERGIISEKSGIEYDYNLEKKMSGIIHSFIVTNTALESVIQYIAKTASNDFFNALVNIIKEQNATLAKRLEEARVYISTEEFYEGEKRIDDLIQHTDTTADELKRILGELPHDSSLEDTLSTLILVGCSGTMLLDILHNIEKTHLEELKIENKSEKDVSDKDSNKITHNSVAKSKEIKHDDTIQRILEEHLKMKVMRELTKHPENKQEKLQKIVVDLKQHVGKVCDKKEKKSPTLIKSINVRGA